jgi:hypothetical protein
MKLTPRNEDDAKRLAKRSLLAVGWHAARITEAVEKPSKRGNEMIEITLLIPAEDGERTIRDWFTDSPLAALKLRRAAEAVGALAKYEAGEISASDFPGFDVKVKLTVQKRRAAGYPDANAVEDYAPAEAGQVVNLRQAAS